MGDILVAGVAITFGRVGDKPNVGNFLVLNTAVTTVTDNAADLTMSALNKLGVLEEDLLPYLQRR